MKKQKKQNRYQEKVDWDDMTVGELSHHIGKKMTEKVVKSKRTYSRKTKHKNRIADMKIFILSKLFIMR